MAAEREDGPLGGRDLSMGWVRPDKTTVSMKSMATVEFEPGIANS